MTETTRFNYPYISADTHFINAMLKGNMLEALSIIRYILIEVLVPRFRDRGIYLSQPVSDDHFLTQLKGLDLGRELITSKDISFTIENWLIKRNEFIYKISNAINLGIYDLKNDFHRECQEFAWEGYTLISTTEKMIQESFLEEHISNC